MTDTATATSHTDGRRWQDALRDVTNAATVKGAVAILAGLTVMLVPDLSLQLVELSVGIALVASGLYDLYYAAVGSRAARSGSRLLAIPRGLVSLVIGLLALLIPRDTLAVLILLLGVYLLVRGLVSLVAALFSRDRAQRQLRLATAAGGIAFGVLALAVPESLADGIIITGAIVAIVVGGIVLAYGLRVGMAHDSNEAALTSASVPEILWEWVRTSDVGTERREYLADTLYFESPGRAGKLTAWWVMLMLSVSIATFAVLQDSTAVVIGAMLIAPLMTPILGLSGAIVNGWTHRAASSSALVAMGVAASIGLATLISAWVPELVAFDSNSQVLSRVDPTFVDMLIALAAGAAGAFATVNSRVASSIAGVAIAVALVPPLSVVGLSLQSARWEDALGAFLLFLTNFVSIVLAATAVFVLTGFAEGTGLRARRRQVGYTLAPFISLALVVLVPLVFTAEGILATASQQKKAQSEVDEWLEDTPRLLAQQVVVDGSTVSVSVTGSQQPPPPEDLQTSLSESLGKPIDLIIDYTPSIRLEVDSNGQTSVLKSPTEALLE